MSRVSDVEGDVKSKLDVSHVEHSGADYSRNINAKIRNPLIGISSSDLRVQVTGFCREFGFEEKENVFYRGALAAQNPENYESIDDLTEEDKHVLRREVTHKWHLPKDLYYSIALCSLGSAIQGWDNTGANGANLSFPQEFGIENNQALVGVINAGPTLFGLLSAWAADPINNYLGRRGTIFLTGLFCVFPVLAQAFTQNWWGLMICRLFMGLGMGIKISTIPIYSAEVAPAAIRGGIVTSFQLWVAFGIFVGFCSNLIWYRIGDLAWRFQLAAAFAPAIPVLIFVWMCPGKGLTIVKIQESMN
ncbi:hypothetical protein N0V92_002439 [Colletotrichum tropicale]|nr:hypothetical protein N0V92_002439 [Colletotrichum tropicale]